MRPEGWSAAHDEAGAERQRDAGAATRAQARAGRTVRRHRAGALQFRRAGNESGPDSDVDILVRFDRPTDPECYFGVQFYIEDLLGKPVDLVTDRVLRPELRPYIEAEAVRV